MFDTIINYLIVLQGLVKIRDCSLVEAHTDLIRELSDEKLTDLIKELKQLTKILQLPAK